MLHTLVISEDCSAGAGVKMKSVVMNQFEDVVVMELGDVWAASDSFESEEQLDWTTCPNLSGRNASRPSSLFYISALINIVF